MEFRRREILERIIKGPIRIGPFLLYNKYMNTEILIVFSITFFVRMWSTLVGGGGSIMIPMLLFMGLPPAQAIATNRFSGASNILTIIKFNQLGLVKWKLGLFLAIFSGI